MSLEIELKLSLRASDVPRLMAHPLLAGQMPRRERLLNTYFDTSTLTLMAQRIAVRERQVGRRTLLTVKTAGSSVGGLSQRQEWEAPTQPGQFDFAALIDDDTLASSLSALAWQLVPVFRTDFVRHTWQLRQGNTHVEVALDQGWITTGDGQGPHCEPLLELELELKTGPADALLDLAHTLALGPHGDAASGLWLHPVDRSKAERGLALFLGQKQQPTPAQTLTLTPDMAAVSAFRCAAMNCMSHLQANAAGLMQTRPDHLPDPEFVHQCRVALRRLRTGLRLFAPFLPRRFTSHWQDQWRQTAQTLGEARNWDVLATEALPALLEGITGAIPVEELQAWVDAQRRTANQLALALLTHPSHTSNLLAFTRAVLALPAESRSTESLADWAVKQLRVRHQRLRREVRRALHAGPEGRHELRIELKKLRYAQSFLSSLLRPKHVARSTATLARIQDLLGHLNDLSTAQALLERCPLPEAQMLHARAEARIQDGLEGLPRIERALLKAHTLWG
ncbi:CYTH and CHAD domain-containing protein [Hydrogenophaga sp.]|uniref:CYTH and CHAD domain-containing protein n=1 Tax=Hydrogenophaga sp. TaxID=1904254 RepID=UPI0027223834|nr:CYTH and CHAD domain-containing protein [Hydrogenophaga sp.]MDO8903565.1 CHAD domain-containing protein [Hydrogenophaga sp.]